LSSACGSHSSQSSAGAKIFSSARCAGCHTLSAAGATGQVGPNLDLVKPDAVTVAHQVRVGGGGMPSFAGKLTPRQIQQVASFVATASRSSGSGVAFKPDGTTIADCEKKPKPFCFRQAFGNLAFSRGPRIALAQLPADSSTIPAVAADCHQISHWLGHASLAYYHNNAADALAHGGMTCSSGYYHGVIELSLSGLPRDRVIRIARRLCTGPSVTREDFLLYQCVHGLGHGLMIYSGDDLPYSLHVCDLLTTKYHRVSCTGGVFMQNLDTSMVVSRYVKRNDPIYPCNWVARRHKVYCYLQVTERILQVVGHNWAKAALWCRRSERGWVATCFQSLGRDASGSSQYHPEETLRHCAEAGTWPASASTAPRAITPITSPAAARRRGCATSRRRVTAPAVTKESGRSSAPCIASGSSGGPRARRSAPRGTSPPASAARRSHDPVRPARPGLRALPAMERARGAIDETDTGARPPRPAA
jgi:hypothetical protein